MLTLQPWPALLQDDRTAVRADRGLSGSAWATPHYLPLLWLGS
jgi:hypothetical protein